MDSIEVKANAKINLALAVKYKRDDGYHEIELIFQEIDFHDRIILEKANSLSFRTDSKLLQKESDNLCLTAAKYLQEEFGIPGLNIFLEKKLPIGSGLGGGSSDAASVLKGGIDLHGIEIPHQKLQSIAEKIGSDVPFFLKGGTAYGSGRGEILKTIQITTDYFILLVIPEIKISTPWAYKNLNLTLTRKNDDYKFKGFAIQNLNLVDFRSEFHNDFENLVFKHHPELASVKSDVYKLGAEYASLSGSGSALYGLYKSKSAAENAGEKLKSKHSIYICRPVRDR
jgi:4-diphosphocytidyl-2-C-methyl-D-erythritol kinase